MLAYRSRLLLSNRTEKKITNKTRELVITKPKKNIECPYIRTHTHTLLYRNYAKRSSLSIFLSSLTKGRSLLFALNVAETTRLTIIFVFLHALPNKKSDVFTFLNSFQNSFSSNKHKEPFI